MILSFLIKKLKINKQINKYGAPHEVTFQNTNSNDLTFQVMFTELDNFPLSLQNES